MKTISALALAVGIMLAGCTSPEQKLLEADQSYSVTQNRVLKYVTLPECTAGVTAGCDDPAVKAELKAETAAHAGATDAKGVAAADAELTGTLAKHGINCGAGASDPCP